MSRIEPIESHLCKKVRQAIAAAFPDAEITFESIEGSRMVITGIISSHFEGVEEEERQRQVWNLLNASLKSFERMELSAVLTLTPAEAQMDDLTDCCARALRYRGRLIVPPRWEIQPIEAYSTGFQVLNGRATMARWVFDPALPWVLVEGHDPLARFEWTDVHVPLSPASFNQPISRCVSRIEMDLLLPTSDFLNAIEEFDQSGSGGLNVWQLDRKPKPGLRLSEKQFDPDVSRATFEALCRGVGVRLAIILPHSNELSSVSGLNPEDVRAAWLRGMAANGD